MRFVDLILPKVTSFRAEENTTREEIQGICAVIFVIFLVFGHAFSFSQAGSIRFWIELAIGTTLVATCALRFFTIIRRKHDFPWYLATSIALMLEGIAIMLVGVAAGNYLWTRPGPVSPLLLIAAVGTMLWGIKPTIASLLIVCRLCH